MKCLISIDTEADNQWISSNQLTVENLNFIPRFQALCESFHFIPTYLCTHEIVDSENFENTLLEFQDKGHAEIGSHLHPWSNPPFENPSENLAHAFPTELSNALFKKKMSNLTDLIEHKAGRRPSSYRAGRWGLNASHIPVLLELGYIVDSSVTPFIDWNETIGVKKHGEDFRRAPCRAYSLNMKDVCKEGDSGLIEIPPTIVFLHGFMEKSKLLQEFYSKHSDSALAYRLDKLFNIGPKWLRPFPETSSDLLIKICKLAMTKNFQYVHLMFHSSELMPKGSPYTPTQETVDEIFDKLKNVFNFLVKSGVKPSTLNKFGSNFTSRNSRR